MTKPKTPPWFGRPACRFWHADATEPQLFRCPSFMTFVPSHLTILLASQPSCQLT
jgi:hypothetical protein